MKKLLIFATIIGCCLVGCSSSEYDPWNHSAQASMDLTTPYLLSKIKNISYGFELNFSYDQYDRLIAIDQNEGALLAFTYLSDPNGDFSGLRKIELFRPLNNDFCGFEGRYPDTFIVDSVASDFISFRRETIRPDNSVACFEEKYITYTFQDNLIKRFTINYSESGIPGATSSFNFKHDAEGNLQEVYFSGPTLRDQKIMEVLSYQENPHRPDAFNIFGSDLWVFQQYFFPNATISNKNPQSALVYDGTKEYHASYQFDNSGLVVSQELLANGTKFRYEKEYIPLE